MIVSSYQVLARKWRPAQLSDIVGQSHVVRTLRNAILSQRVHQAYLFTGSRGIGKTSIARILAKLIRCEKVHLDSTQGLRSCDECACCKEIAVGMSMDVIEIDGASNNGVDAIREIRENAKFLPSTGFRKIYIVDEVHMLTTAAFNALLKTLEEPPPHLVFIFATTEPHKIPVTILSRCQRFDYRRVTPLQIQSHLVEILKVEGIEAESGALALIAGASEGSMRDALSLLDQVIAFSGKNITAQHVQESIGLIGHSTVLGILEAIFLKKPLEAILLAEPIYQQGYDLRIFVRNLIEFLHKTILLKVGGSQSLMSDLSDEERGQLSSIAKLRTIEEMELIFQVFHQGIEWIARSPQPKIILDVLLIKCAAAEVLVDISSPLSSSEKAAPKNSLEKMPPPLKPPHSSPVALSHKGTVEKVPFSLSPIRESSSTDSHVQSPSLSSGSSKLILFEQSQKFKVRQQPHKAGVLSWEGFIEHVRKSRPLLASILEHGSCISLPSATKAAEDLIENESKNKNYLLTLAYSSKETYFREQLQTRTYQEQLLTLSQDYFGQAIHIQIEQNETTHSVANQRKKETQDRERVVKERAMNHPIIREAQALFVGTWGPIECVFSQTLEGESPYADL